MPSMHPIQVQWRTAGRLHMGESSCQTLLIEKTHCAIFLAGQNQLAKLVKYWLPHPYRSAVGTLHEIKYFPFQFCFPVLWCTESSWEAKCELSRLQGPGTGFQLRVFVPTDQAKPLFADTRAGTVGSSHGHAGR